MTTTSTKLHSQATTAVRWTSIGAAGTVTAELFRVFIMSRLLSPDDFGLMGISYIIVGLAQAFVDVGMGAAIIHRQDITSDQLSSLYWLNIFTGLALYVCVLALTPFLIATVGDPRLGRVLAVVSMVLVISPVTQQFEILLRKELAFRTIARIDIAGSVVSLISVIACGFMGAGVWTLVTAYLSSVVVRTLLLAQIGFHRFRPAFRFSRLDVKSFIAFGSFQLGARVVSELRVRFDQILIARFLGVHELGLYNFATNIVSRPQTGINPIITRVAFPAFARMQGDTARLREGYLRVVRVLALVNAPLLLGFAAVAGVAVPFAFGEKWRGAVEVAQILCCVGLLRSLHNPISVLRLAVGRADTGFWWEVFMLVVSCPVIFLGAVHGKLSGVASALLLLECLMAVPAYWLLIRPTLGGCWRDYFRSMLKPVSISALMAVVVLAIPSYQPAVLTVVIKLTTGIVVYGGLLAIVDRTVFREAITFALARNSA